MLINVRKLTLLPRSHPLTKRNSLVNQVQGRERKESASNNYWSRNLINLSYCFWIFKPKKFDFLTRLSLTGWHTQGGHETKQYRDVNITIMQPYIMVVWKTEIISAYVVIMDFPHLLLFCALCCVHSTTHSTPTVVDCPMNTFRFKQSHFVSQNIFSIFVECLSIT